MKRQIVLPTILAVIVIVVSMFAVLVSPVKAPGQPPVDTSTFYEGAIGWGPRRADPARAYDTASAQLISNVYETLIAPVPEKYNDTKLVLASSFSRSEESLTGMFSADLDPSTGIGTWSGSGDSGSYVGFADVDGTGTVSVGDTLYVVRGSGQHIAYVVTNISGAGPYTLDVKRYLKIYGIRTSPVISFFLENGAIVDTMDAADVVYSFQRGLVQDQTGSPQWMFYKAFFGQMNSDPWGVNAASSVVLAKLIDSAVSISAFNMVTFSLGGASPEAAWNRTLDNFGYIVSKQFSMGLAPNWDGNLLTLNGTGWPTWWGSIRHIRLSGYDTTDAYRWVGTGPFRVSTFDQGNSKVIMSRNPSWWQGWPFPGSGNAFSQGYVETYEIDYISDWTTRKSAFISGALDVCAVPRANKMELLNPTTLEPNLALDRYMETVKNINPTLSLDAVLFTFKIAETSPYVGTGNFPDGIPLDFFNNVHVRRAFAYSFDPALYKTVAYYDEANYRRNMFITGLLPDFYNPPVNYYSQDFFQAESELKLATFGSSSVWASGFTVNMLYSAGDREREIAVEMTRAFFMALSSWNGRVGPPFTVQPTIVQWSDFLALFESQEMPIYTFGWLTRYDFADADDFARAFMHSNGELAYLQGYTAANGWGSLKDNLIDKAAIETNDANRQTDYTQLQQIYYDDCPSYPLVNPFGRRWCQHWVKGWYYDAIYPGVYDELYPTAYMASVYKYDDCWFDISGPTIALSDGIVNMRDIIYLIQHFNALAPIPNKNPHPLWDGSYGGNGCVDPYGDRKCNMRDVQGAILHFNHKHFTLTP